MKEHTEKTASAESAAETQVRPAPILIEKKKRKKKYSRGFLRSIQEFEGGMSKSARKVIKAVRDGMEAYEDSRDESASAKKDGAIRDLLKNQSKALRVALPIAAEAPADFLDAIADMKVVRDLMDRDEDEDDD